VDQAFEEGLQHHDGLGTGDPVDLRVTVDDARYPKASRP
jgi:hypothetical protein